MRVKLDKSRWDRFWSYWERDLPGQIKTAKGQAVRAAGEAIRDEVAGQVRSRVNDPRGRVERWQQLRMGSGGGYIAVSPVSDEAVQVTRGGKNTTSKDVTRYLERGHGIRPPSGRAGRYVPRVRSGRTYVPGRMFYSWAAANAEKLALKAADRAMGRIADEIDY